MLDQAQAAKERQIFKTTRLLEMRLPEMRLNASKQAHLVMKTMRIKHRRMMPL
jgi:hypothetical protein